MLCGITVVKELNEVAGDEIIPIPRTVLFLEGLIGYLSQK